MTFLAFVAWELHGLKFEIPKATEAFSYGARNHARSLKNSVRNLIPMRCAEA